jgi:hypothetical protein
MEHDGGRQLDLGISERRKELISIFGLNRAYPCPPNGLLAEEMMGDCRNLDAQNGRISEKMVQKINEKY